MTRAGRLAVLLVLALSLPASAEDRGPRLRFWKGLDRGAATGEEILAVPLDGDIFAATRDGYPDLRILDDRDAEVPYLLERVGRRPTTPVRERCAGKVISLRVDEGKALEIVAELDEKAPPATGLTIRTPLADYEHRVRVFGSRSGDDWKPLVADGLIYDYSRFMDIRNRDIVLPPNEDRRYKLVVEQGLDEHESPFRELIRGQEEGKKDRRIEMTRTFRRPFRIDGIELWRTVEREGASQPETIAYPVAGFRVEHDAKDKVSRIEVQSRREPLTRFTVASASRNFSRPARVLVPVLDGVRTEWAEIGRGTLVLIAFREFRRAELSLDFPEHRHEHYRIEIDNADNPPLEITGVEAEGPRWRLVFLGSEGRTYRVAYGSDASEPPRYDTTAVLDALHRGYQPVSAKLGPQTANPAYREGHTLPGFFNGAVFLTLAIITMVLALAWILFRAGQQLKKLPQEDV